MNKNLLSKAKLLGCDTYQDFSNKWVIKSFRNNETWSIREKESGEWIITSGEIPISILKTERIIEFLDLFDKKQKFSKKRKLITP